MILSDNDVAMIDRMRREARFRWLPFPVLVFSTAVWLLVIAMAVFDVTDYLDKNDLSYLAVIQMQASTDEPTIMGLLHHIQVSRLTFVVTLLTVLVGANIAMLLGHRAKMARNALTLRVVDATRNNDSQPI